LPHHGVGKGEKKRAKKRGQSVQASPEKKQLTSPIKKKQKNQGGGKAGERREKAEKGTTTLW